jgi:hypothetical protein
MQFSLTDFKPEMLTAKKQEDAEDQKISDYLSKIPTKELANKLRENGHPAPAWGEGETWRMYYLTEFSRRGLKVYENLGWPSDPESVYYNRWTGCLETLQEITMGPANFKLATIASQCWSVVENWEPYKQNVLQKRNKIRIKYLKESIEGNQYSKETIAEMKKELYILSRDA